MIASVIVTINQVSKDVFLIEKTDTGYIVEIDGKTLTVEAREIEPFFPVGIIDQIKIREIVRRLGVNSTMSKVALEMGIRAGEITQILLPKNFRKILEEEGIVKEVPVPKQKIEIKPMIPEITLILEKWVKEGREFDWDELSRELNISKEETEIRIKRQDEFLRRLMSKIKENHQRTRELTSQEIRRGSLIVSVEDHALDRAKERLNMSIGDLRNIFPQTAEYFKNKKASKRALYKHRGSESRYFGSEVLGVMLVVENSRVVKTVYEFSDFLNSNSFDVVSWEKE